MYGFRSRVVLRCCVWIDSRICVSKQGVTNNISPSNTYLGHYPQPKMHSALYSRILLLLLTVLPPLVLYSVLSMQNLAITYTRCILDCLQPSTYLFKMWFNVKASILLTDRNPYICAGAEFGVGNPLKISITFPNNSLRFGVSDFITWQFTTHGWFHGQVFAILLFWNLLPYVAPRSLEWPLHQPLPQWIHPLHPQ